ncbi:MAG TPA: ATP-binding protein [Ktedonobacteraceae bacterium]
MALASSIPSHNPYGHLTAIRDPKLFVGRTHELRRLYASINDQQCISIVGTRRIGKSSILCCMQLPEMQERYASEYDLSKHILVFVDLGEFVQKTRDDFFNHIATQLVVQCKDHLPLEMPSRSNADGFSDLLDEIKETKFHPVLLLDAFDTITRNPQFDPNFFTFLRAQANRGRVSYVTASIASLDKFCHPDIVGSPFFNIFSLCHLGPLMEKETQQLITTPTHNSECQFTEDEVKRVVHLAGRHPFFINRVCYWLFEEKWYKDYASERAMLKYVKDLAHEDLLPHFEHIWNASLDTEQREDLKEEARRKEVKQRRMPELSESALFRKFVRNTCNIKSAQITGKHLEKVLENLNDAKVLGESHLIDLDVVYMRAQSEPSPHLPLQKGLIVRKILCEAFERLRPNEMQTDMSVVWRLYNILDYSYFKPHANMNNEQIAARLGISLRQFYRERGRAIELLLNTLIEMETSTRDNLDDT